jgi:hypothetical protein
MLAVLLTCLALAVPGDTIDRIMAVVGGQPITLSDVAGVRQFQLIEVPGDAPDPIGFVVDRLIDRTLMLAEVNRFQPPEPDASEIDSRVNEMQARAGSTAAFEKSLAMTGMTAEQIRRFVRDSLRMDTYVNQRFGSILDPVERAASIAAWTGDLRRRAQITVLYRPSPSGSEARVPGDRASR